MESIGNVEVKEHKGQYGDLKNKSANAIYKTYVTWKKERKEIPLPFMKWMEWAKEKGLLAKNLNANAAEPDVKKEETEKVAEAVAGATSTVVKVIIASFAVYLLFAIFSAPSSTPDNKV